MTKFEEVLQLINSDITVRLALKTLVEEGCDQNRIVYFVYVYCRGGSPDEADRTLESARYFVNRWKKLSEKLREDAGEVELALKQVAEMQIGKFDYLEDQTPASVMRKFADLLEKLQKSLRPVVNPKSGRNETLAYLCYLVEAATGKKHYREIAVLIDTFHKEAAEAYKKKLDEEDYEKKLADNVRNRVNRYEKDQPDPEWVQRLREEAEDEVALWRESGPKKKEPPRSRRKKKFL